ncbi:lipocalin family protein [Larkinella insperata]|uniref:Lipocalin family protein n=1 Tax=Larkinella insperata TaxID=332158 RepID=A0ABW3QDG8_9BACT|nr:lipocalin family protein [Larkinella insperata]
MKVNHYLIIVTLSVVTLFGCSKSKDDVKPETESLLTRKWSFSEISVKTDAKTYAIPPSDDATFFGEDNTITFNNNNTYSTVEDGKVIETGTWKLSGDGKTLTLTDIDKTTTDMTINTLSNTAIELATKNVDVTKNDQSDEELNIAFVAGMLLYTIDLDNGGKVDFSQEPEPKSYQLLLKGKAL